MPLAIGTLLNNRYRIVSILGQGGMGAVYRASDEHLLIPVAVKENDPAVAAEVDDPADHAHEGGDPAAAGNRHDRTIVDEGVDIEGAGRTGTGHGIPRLNPVQEIV